MSKRNIFLSLLLICLTFSSKILATDYFPKAEITALAPWAISNNNLYNTNTGNIGVGISAPIFKLDVLGYGSSYPINLRSSGKYIRIGAQNSTYAHFDTDTTKGFYFYDPLTVDGNIFVTGTNNLSIGDTFHSLKKVNFSDIGPYLSLTADSGFVFTQARNGFIPLIVRSNGNIGVGTTGVQYRLTVAGDGSLSSGNHPVASFTQSQTNGVYLGYQASGSAVTSGSIVTDNNLPLSFGSSNGTNYLIINKETTEINGGVRLNPNPSQVTKPGCVNQTRGLLWFTAGVGGTGPNAKDTLQLCAQDQNGQTSWQTLY